MNIFVLDRNPEICAKFHSDRHVPKMVLETAQILCSAIHRNINDGMEEAEKHDNHIRECENCALEASENEWSLEETQNALLELKNTIPYKATHLNHPCVVWASESFMNFSWLMKLGIELGKQFEERFGKKHKSVGVINNLFNLLPDVIDSFRGSHPTEFPLAMPDEFKDTDAVVSYRNYYEGAKSELAVWEKGVEQPKWFKRN